ncbi:MAG: phytoene desaturase family protein [Myxococcales bacterium]|jgi:phytoene dehydrogenase-like protein
MPAAYDAVVVGSGPNGLAAAIAIAQAGRSVLVLEGQPSIGGGACSAELTLPGFVHDVCSSSHPLGLASPFFRTLGLERFGLDWIHPEIPLAHPLEGGRAVLLERSHEATAARLARDSKAYRRLMLPLLESWQALLDDILGLPRLPRSPLSLARFGARALWPAERLARRCFRTREARALFAGLSAHSGLPLERMPSAAFGLVLGALGHAVGWPFARGGAQRLADALAACLRSLGGEIVTGFQVERLADLPRARAVLCDVTPRQLLRLAGGELPPRFRRRLARYRYGPGTFKLDWALSEPIPWAAEACRRVGTVHVGGTLDEIARSEREPWLGRVSDAPFVLVTQPSLFDPARAPPGRHTAWAYCHVPLGFRGDVTALIEGQIERFAPGFREVVLARHVMGPDALERHDPNLIGGDVNGGGLDLRQLFIRPTTRLWSTPCRGLYLCSSSTPPGGGVHGMCGLFAARRALREVLS